MGRQRPADHLPSHVLTRPDFVQACGQRDLGRILHIAKQWGGVGFSSSHLARRCEMTVSRVQDYIAGRVRAQRVEIFERVADGLHIPGALLELAPRPWESADDTPTTDGDAEVLRRDFFKLGAGVAVGLATTGAATPSGVSGNRVGSSTVEVMRSNLVRLRRLDDHMGGADTFRLYAYELDRSSRLLKDSALSTGGRKALHGLMAEQAQQAGWAAFDTGWAQKATQLFEHSFQAARAAECPDLAGNALALRSYQLLAADQDPSDLTTRSLHIAASSNHPAVQSLLYQRGAWTYAMAGNVEQTDWALGQAAEALTRAPAEPAPDWAAWAHSPLELEIMTGRCWAQLHRPLRAIPALESAMAQYDDSHARDKALYLTWLADAYLDGGEVEQAAAITTRAVDLSSLVASTRPQERFAEVLQRLRPHQGAAGVGELLARGTFHPRQVRG